MKTLLDLVRVFATRGISAAGGFLLSLVVAKETGSEGLGAFALFLSYLCGAAILSRRGLETIIIREVAHTFYRNSQSKIPVLVLRSLRHVFVGSIVVSIPLVLLNLYLGVFSFNVLCIFLLAFPLISFLGVIAGYFKGIGKAWIAPFFEIGGISFFATIVVFSLSRFNVQQSSPTIIFEISLISLLLLALSLYSLKKNYSISLIGAWKSNLLREEVFRLTKGQVSFTLVGIASFLLQAGSFAIVGPILSDHELGLARAAERLALIMSFPVLAINPFIASKVVKYFQSGSKKLMYRLVILSSLLGSVLVLPLLLFFLLFPQLALSLYGSEFEKASDLLLYFSLANFLLVALGPFDMVMNMCEGENIQMKISIGMLLLSLICYPLFASIFGLLGFVVSYVVIVSGRSILVLLSGLLLIQRMNERDLG
jgi:O-antigen/teichoic acid export membrane protein